tara:strand:- start:173 stop:637 length:465 start_codon:yes stop_codon:yes gene_type:complete
MLTILGSLLGFAGSAVPSIIDAFKEKEDQKSKVEMFKLQLEAKEKGVDLDIKLMETKAAVEEQKSLIEHDIALGKQGGFINSLRAFVRPFITYVFFLTFIGVKITLVWDTISKGGDLNATLAVIWDEQTEALFAAIISFWFGSRAMPKIKQLNK